MSGPKTPQNMYRKPQPLSPVEHVPYYRDSQKGSPKLRKQRSWAPVCWCGGGELVFSIFVRDGSFCFAFACNPMGTLCRGRAHVRRPYGTFWSLRQSSVTFYGVHSYAKALTLSPKVSSQNWGPVQLPKSNP